MLLQPRTKGSFYRRYRLTMSGPFAAYPQIKKESNEERRDRKRRAHSLEQNQSTNGLNRMQEFEEALEKIPMEERSAYSEALELVPHLVEEESNPEFFLQTEDNDVDAASRRLVNYWNHRKKIFKERAFRPLVLSRDGALSDGDYDFIELAVLAPLPCDNKGRPVAYIDVTRIGDLTVQSPNVKNHRFANMFYQLSKLGVENVKARTDGIVMIRFVDPHNFHPAQFKKSADLLADSLPLKISKFHFCCSPSSAERKHVALRITPMLIESMGKSFPGRVHVHLGKPRTLLKLLQQEGFREDGLPPKLGGTWSYELYQQDLESLRNAEIRKDTLAIAQTDNMVDSNKKSVKKIKCHSSRSADAYGLELVAAAAAAASTASNLTLKDDNNHCEKRQKSQDGRLKMLEEENRKLKEMLARASTSSSAAASPAPASVQNGYPGEQNKMAMHGRRSDPRSNQGTFKDHSHVREDTHPGARGESRQTNNVLDSQLVLQALQSDLEVVRSHQTSHPACNNIATHKQDLNAGQCNRTPAQGFQILPFATPASVHAAPSTSQKLSIETLQAYLQMRAGGNHENQGQASYLQAPDAANLLHELCARGFGRALSTQTGHSTLSTLHKQQQQEELQRKLQHALAGLIQSVPTRASPSSLPTFYQQTPDWKHQVHQALAELGQLGPAHDQADLRQQQQEWQRQVQGALAGLSESVLAQASPSTMSAFRHKQQQQQQRQQQELQFQVQQALAGLSQSAPAQASPSALLQQKKRQQEEWQRQVHQAVAAWGQPVRAQPSMTNVSTFLQQRQGQAENPAAAARQSAPTQAWATSVPMQCPIQHAAPTSTAAEWVLQQQQKGNGSVSGVAPLSTFAGNGEDQVLKIAAASLEAEWSEYLPTLGKK